MKSKTLRRCLRPCLMRQRRNSEPGATQPGIGADGGALHTDRLDRDGGMNDRVPAQAQGKISLQRMPGEAPHFACIAHNSFSHTQAAWPTGNATGATRTCSRNFGQSIRRSCPFMSSTNEVQLSTQSPSLQYRIPLISRISARWICPQTTVSTPRFRAAWATASSKLPMY